MTDFEREIIQGRAYIRVIEAANILLKSGLEESKMVALREAHRICFDQLRALVAPLPPNVVAQRMVASDKIIGAVMDVGLN